MSNQMQLAKLRVPVECLMDDPIAVAQLASAAAEAADEIERLHASALRQNKLMHLAAQDAVFFGGFFYNPNDTEFRVPAPVVFCSDFFAPAADCEELPPECIDELHDAYVRFGQPGVMAWVSLRRGGENPWRLRPDSEHLEKFEKARVALAGHSAEQPASAP